MSELQKRIVTGLIGAAVLLSLIIEGGHIGVGILTAVISLAMTYEFAGIVFSQSDAMEKRYALLSLGWLILVGAMFVNIPEAELLALGFLALFAYFLFSARRHAGSPSDLSTHLHELMYAAFGVLYLTFLPLFLPRIDLAANGVHWVMILLLINWSVDIGAYFGGKKWGKTKLYPLISPKKTREGGLVGLGAAVIVTILYKLVIWNGLSWGTALAAPLVVGVVCQVGDLCESFVKRAFDKKDSGSLLPGHGGFLDRFDGVVFSLPVMYALVRWYG